MCKRSALVIECPFECEFKCVVQSMPRRVTRAALACQANSLPPGFRSVFARTSRPAVRGLSALPPGRTTSPPLGGVVRGPSGAGHASGCQGLGLGQASTISGGSDRGSVRVQAGVGCHHRPGRGLTRARGEQTDVQGRRGQPLGHNEQGLVNPLFTVG